MHYIIGSGPASIAAAVALANRGLKVTILDPGKTLEPERQAVLDRLSKQDANQWSPADLQALRGAHGESHGKIASKLNYGSDYPYTDLAEPLQQDREHSPFNYSMAKGGLSTVWGAALEPFCQKDIEAWPVTLNELAPHYRAVLDFVPCTGDNDELQEFLPTYTEEFEQMRPSSQFKRFLSSLRSNRKQLNASGIHFGAARMAIAAKGDAHRKACNYCGLCLDGCPYSLIYNSASTLDALIERGAVTYLPGHIVEKFTQNGDRVTIHARRVPQATEGTKGTQGTKGTNEVTPVNPVTEVTFEAERVFVGAGVIPTTYLMLNSLGAYNAPIEVVDSQYFIYPFFQFRRSPEVEQEPVSATAQVFLEIDAPSVSKNLVHMEVFGYSDFVKKAMMETPLRFLLWNKWIAKQFFGRLLILQCFIHSDDSSRLVAELVKDGASPKARPQLKLTPLSRFTSFWTSLKAGLILFANAFRLGGILALPGLQFAGAGRSYHSGGTFPMSKNPAGFQTDRLGRIPSMDRVHIVDASVFPTIPATTITLSVMANAHRIASEAAEL